MSLIFFSTFNLILFIILAKNVEASDTNQLNSPFLQYADVVDKFAQVEKCKKYIDSAIHDEKLKKEKKKTTVTDTKKEIQEISSQEEPKNKEPVKKMKRKSSFHNKNIGSKTNETRNLADPQNKSAVKESQAKKKNKNKKNAGKNVTSDITISRIICKAERNDTKETVNEKKENDESVVIFQIEEKDNKNETHRNEKEAKKTKYKLKEEIVKYKKQSEEKEKSWEKQNYLNEQEDGKKKEENENNEERDEMDAKCISDIMKTEGTVKKQMPSDNLEKCIDEKNYNNKKTSNTSNTEASSAENEKSTIECDVEKSEDKKRPVNLENESIVYGRREKHVEKILEKNDKEEEYKYINNNNNDEGFVETNVSFVQLDEDYNEMDDINEDSEKHTKKAENSNELTIEGRRSKEGDSIDVTESPSDYVMNVDTQEGPQNIQKHIYLNRAVELIVNEDDIYTNKNATSIDTEDFEEEEEEEEKIDWGLYRRTSLNTADNIRRYLDEKKKRKNAKRVMGKKILVGLGITLGFVVSGLIGFLAGRESSHINSNAKYLLAQHKLLNKLIKDSSK